MTVLHSGKTNWAVPGYPNMLVDGHWEIRETGRRFRRFEAHVSYLAYTTPTGKLALRMHPMRAFTLAGIRKKVSKQCKAVVLDQTAKLIHL